MTYESENRRMEIIIAERDAEIARLKGIVGGELKPGEFTYCAYCAAAFPEGPTATDAITQHIHECPNHPMRAVEQRAEKAEATIAKRDAEIERLRGEISEYDDERSEHQDERARLEQEVGCLSLAHGGLFTRISNLLERLETCDGGAKKDAEIERLNEQLAETCEAHRALAEKHVTIEEATLLECAEKAEAEIERLKAELAEAQTARVNLNADVLLLRKKLATALAKLSQQERET